MGLTLELHTDGGIRLGTPEEDGPRHIARLEQACSWAADSAGRGEPVQVTGQVNAPLAQAVLRAVQATGAELVVSETTPAPWSDGLSALQFAAREGFADYVVDLLDRGASSEATRADLTPYRLAMVRGHIPVLQALRAAGVRDPVKGGRPEGCSPDTVVLRSYLGHRSRRILVAVMVAPVVLGAIGALAIGDAAPLLTGVVVTTASVLLLALMVSLLAGVRVAVDGTALYTRSLRAWKGPVELRRLTALGFTPAVRRTPAYLRFIQPDAGAKLLPGSLVGFDRDVANAIREQPGLRTLLVGFRSWYLMPGLPRFVGRCVAGTDAVLSPPARALLDQYGGAGTTGAG